MPQVRLVILDLDNTLYDWVGFYIPSFLAMIRKLSSETGITESELKASFKLVHEKHKSSEYAFAIEELDVLRARVGKLSTKEVLTRYRAPIEAFRETRQKKLHLYNGVLEMLRTLRSSNRKLVALTDATMFYAVRRLKQLGIEQFFHMICAPRDHGLPEGVKLEDARRYSDPSRYQSHIPLQLHLDTAIRKPDPAILNAILSTMETAPQEAILVGDSLTKDVLLAQRCGVWDVHARYGSRIDAKLFRELLKVTYWTDHDVAEDQMLRRQNITPSFTLNSLPKLIRVINYIEKLASESAPLNARGSIREIA